MFFDLPVERQCMMLWERSCVDVDVRKDPKSKSMDANVASAPQRSFQTFYSIFMLIGSGLARKRSKVKFRTKLAIEFCVQSLSYVT